VFLLISFSTAADNGFYVIKQLQISSLGPKEQQEAINEVRILASLDHPNVTRYYDSFIDDGVLNIVMEIAEHGTLHDRLKVQPVENLGFGNVLRS
jgi:NIMA (never in mitosis gene a)-related kinase